MLLSTITMLSKITHFNGSLVAILTHIACCWNKRQNYKKSIDPATYHGNWARQTGIVCQKNPQKRYIRVVQNKEDYCPDNLTQLVNFKHVTVAEFMENFKILQS